MRMNAKILIRELTRLDKPALEAHFLSLDKEDRRLRFGVPIADAAVRAYVARVDFEHDAAFGVFDDDLSLSAAAHVARSGHEHAELGVSVLPARRRKGLGGALLARAHQRARNWGVRSLFMHCLTENATMMALARRQGMRIVAQQGEADAWLELPPADAASYFGEVFDQRAALLDYAFKQGRAWLAPGR
jgi:GNAT superfamily N-acetyltransferase